MYSFTVDARNGSKSGDICNTCCCEEIQARPGETNKVAVNYAPWSAPIGGRGLSADTVFDVSGCKTCSPDILIEPGFGRTIKNTPLNGTLVPLFPNPDGDPVDYKVLGLFQPAFGSVEIAVDGTFVYTPNPLYTGIDRFWWSANGNVAEFIIAVDQNAQTQIPQPAFTPPVKVVKDRTAVDPRLHIMMFDLAVSPAAKEGDVYRLNVKQPAYDCDFTRYDHISCYDIVIGSCG